MPEDKKMAFKMQPDNWVMYKEGTQTKPIGRGCPPITDGNAAVDWPRLKRMWVEARPTFGDEVTLEDQTRKRVPRRLGIRDFGSKNHTYHRVSGVLRLNSGDIVVVGGRRLLFKGLETGRGEARPKPAPKPETRAAAPQAPAAAAPAGEAAVLNLEGAILGALAVAAEKTILAQLKSQGLATKERSQLGGQCHGLYSCEAGTCGQCIVRVTAGAEVLSKLGGKEKRTLKTMVEALNEDQGRDLKLAECRLGCMARVENAGGVQIELQGDTEAD